MAPAVSPYRTMVGTTVTSSASTGQTAVCSSALTSVLLPRLNSPTTATLIERWSSRALAPSRVLRQIAAILGHGQFPAPVQPGQRLVHQLLLARELVGVGCAGTSVPAAPVTSRVGGGGLSRRGRAGRPGGADRRCFCVPVPAAMPPAAVGGGGRAGGAGGVVGAGRGGEVGAVGRAATGARVGLSARSVLRRGCVSAPGRSTEAGAPTAGGGERVPGAAGSALVGRRPELRPAGPLPIPGSSCRRRRRPRRRRC